MLKAPAEHSLLQSAKPLRPKNCIHFLQSQLCGLEALLIIRSTSLASRGEKEISSLASARNSFRLSRRTDVERTKAVAVSVITASKAMPNTIGINIGTADMMPAVISIPVMPDAPMVVPNIPALPMMEAAAPPSVPYAHIAAPLAAAVPTAPMPTAPPVRNDASAAVLIYVPATYPPLTALYTINPPAECATREPPALSAITIGISGSISSSPKVAAFAVDRLKLCSSMEVPASCICRVG